MKAKFSLRVYRARSWIVEAERTNRSLDERFIFYWIALNSLYGRPKYLESKQTRTPEQRDLESFLEGVTDGLPHGKVASVRDRANSLLSERFLHEGTWKFDVSVVSNRISTDIAAAARSSRAADDSAYLKLVFARLYVQRKQVFHGNATFNSLANRQSLEAAVAVLSVLVPAFTDVVDRQGEQALGLSDAPYKPDEVQLKRLREQKRLSDLSMGTPQSLVSDAFPKTSLLASLGNDRAMPSVPLAPTSEKVQRTNPPHPHHDEWRELYADIEQCQACIETAREKVCCPIQREAMPDPPQHIRILFVGVAPTAQKGPNAGHHFYSKPKDNLRTGLFKVLDGAFKTHITRENNLGLQSGDEAFHSLGFFLVHAAKVRPLYDNAPPEQILTLCATRHLVDEIQLLNPEAICFLGKRRLTKVCQELFGKTLDERPQKVSLGDWRGVAALSRQPVRKWRPATTRVIEKVSSAIEREQGASNQ